MKFNLNFTQIFAIAVTAWLSKSISFRVGNVIVSASANGAPHHFAFNEALVAVEAVFAGKTGSIQVGSTLVTITAR